jgi:hypothetical protein
MMHFQLPAELENEVISAATDARQTASEWIVQTVSEALEARSKTKANEHIRSTTAHGRSPGQYVKPNAETVLATIATCREQLQHAQRTSSQPVSA